MRSGFCWAAGVVLASALLALQDQGNESPRLGFTPKQRMVSWRGFPDRPDVISHRRVAKDTQLKCIEAQHRPDDGGGACILEYDGGEKHVLTVPHSMRAPRDGEVYLEC
jgi:hypothetical protein